MPFKMHKIIFFPEYVPQIFRRVTRNTLIFFFAYMGKLCLIIFYVGSRMGEESAILGRLLADSTVLNKGTEDELVSWDPE